MALQPSIIPHNRLISTAKMRAEVGKVLASGRFAQGPMVRKLEDNLSERARLPRAVCVSSGTAALKLALLSLGIKRGDSVAVPAYSCVALANSVLACDAKLVPIDVVPGNFNLDPLRLAETVVKTRLKAIIGIHLFGLPFEVKRMMVHGIPVIEDCSHGFGDFGGRVPMGSQSGLAILSLYATKYLGGGEGGAVLANDVSRAEFIEGYRDYTDKLPGKHRLNEKMSDIEAALVLARLSNLNGVAWERQKLAEIYDQAFRTLPGYRKNFDLPSFDSKRIWYRYVVLLKNITAEEAIQKLASQGIQGARPVHEWLPQNGAFPVAENAYLHVLSLPLFPGLGKNEQQRVIKAFTNLWNS